MSTSPSETIGKAEGAPKDENDSIATSLQDVIANEVKLQIANALMAIPDLVEEVTEKLFCTTIFSAQGVIHIAVYDARTYDLLRDLEGCACRDD